MLHMLTAIKSIYKLVQACVKTPEGYTDTINSEMGVLQGCILSPLLFTDLPQEGSVILLGRI
jgi:hypothetical protein